MTTPTTYKPRSNCTRLHPESAEVRRTARRGRFTSTIGVACAIAVIAVSFTSVEAKAFCGFFVAKADAKLFNKSSQVVIVRDEDKTVLTMANDYEGKVKDFAMVVPVPTAITREQIHIGDMALVDHIDAYTAPRLAEYNDPDPCYVPRPRPTRAMSKAAGGAPRMLREQ